MLGEALIRRKIDYFIPDRLLIPFLSTDLVNFLGPRFVEGVIFFQTLRPTRQLRTAGGWVAAIVLSEMSLALTGQIQLQLERDWPCDRRSYAPIPEPFLASTTRSTMNCSEHELYAEKRSPRPQRASPWSEPESLGPSVGPSLDWVPRSYLN